MSVNLMPAGSGSAISIRANPQSFEYAIDREGQLVRLVQAKKCPCIKNGRSDLYCTICHGRGYILSMAEEIEVIEENSPHYGDNKIYPWWNPIARVKKIQRWVHPAFGGNVFYTVASFTDSAISIVDEGNLPKRHEPIKVTYNVRNAVSVVGENSEHDGTYTIYTTGTAIDTSTSTSNPLDIHGDLVAVSRVYNRSQDITYSVLSFIKQAIYLDSESGVKPAPLSTDILEVDYQYVPPIKAVITRIDIENAVVKYFEDVKMGDIKMTVKAAYKVGRGDIVSMLSVRVKEQAVITRGAGTADEIPSFDVVEILEDIVDENGVHYDSTKFALQDFNNLVWLGATKPAQGKKYSIIYVYRPSYIVYRQMPSPLNAGDRQYPQQVFLRFLPRLTSKDLELAQ